MCVLSLCVCFVVVVVVRLAVLFVCASAWYRYVVRLGGDFGIVQFGGTVEIVIGRRSHSYYRSHHMRNHLYNNHNHHTQCRYVWFHPKHKLIVGGCGCNRVDTVCHPIQGGVLQGEWYMLALFLFLFLS